MEILLLALTVGLPIVKIMLFPARTMGRGGSWTIIGAVMIVGLMMALWLGVQSLTGAPAAASAAKGDTDDSVAEQQAAEALMKILSPQG